MTDGIWRPTGLNRFRVLTSDGYIRAALTVETPRLLEAVERISKLKL